MVDFIHGPRQPSAQPKRCDAVVFVESKGSEHLDEYLSQYENLIMNKLYR
jgi:hypothetical protein